MGTLLLACAAGLAFLFPFVRQPKQVRPAPIVSVTRRRGIVRVVYYRDEKWWVFTVYQDRLGELVFWLLYRADDLGMDDVQIICESLNNFGAARCGSHAWTHC